MSALPAVEITTLPLSSLRPADYNPRTISSEALSGLAASIKRWGLVEPIVWNRRTGNVVGGHQRLRVLTEEGVAEALVAVIDVSETEEKALNVSLNNPHISGEFTPGLQVTLGELRADLGEAILAALRLDDLMDKAHAPEEVTHVKEKFDVLICCENEMHQRETLEKLIEEGYECRALTS